MRRMAITMLAVAVLAGGCSGLHQSGRMGPVQGRQVQATPRPAPKA